MKNGMPTGWLLVSIAIFIIIATLLVLDVY